MQWVRPDQLSCHYFLNLVGNWVLRQKKSEGGDGDRDWGSGIREGGDHPGCQVKMPERGDKVVKGKSISKGPWEQVGVLMLGSLQALTPYLNHIDHPWPMYGCKGSHLSCNLIQSFPTCLTWRKGKGKGWGRVGRRLFNRKMRWWRMIDSRDLGGGEWVTDQEAELSSPFCY